jgi:hypothetical protein
MRTDLVEDALKMAITLRGELPAQVVFHTDRGTQGEFQRSSQHLEERGAFDGMAEGSDYAAHGKAGDALAGAACAAA